MAYTPTGKPLNQTKGLAADVRNEFVLIQQAIAGLAALAGNIWSGIQDFTGATTKVANPVGPTDAVNLQTMQQVALGVAYPASSGDIGKYLKATGVNTYAFSSFTIANDTPMTTPVLTAPREVAVAMAANNIDCATATVFTKTISGSTTLTVSNVASTGLVTSFILELTNPASNVTWWSGVKWTGGTPPTLTTTGRDVLAFYTRDGGTTWNGIVLGKNMS